MIIKSISLKNIRSYLDETIEFSEGSTLLAGDIGCGKSTILLGIEFALFGLAKGMITGPDLLRHGKNEGHVELKAVVDGKEINIRRRLKRKSTGIMQDSGYLTINGLEFEGSPSEIKARILQMLGYPNDCLSKKRPIFRYTVYTPQESMKSIIYSPDRIETMRKIFDIDKYGVIRQNTAEFCRELRAEKRELESIFYDIEEKRSEILLKAKLIMQAEKDVDEKGIFIEGIRKEMEDLSVVMKNSQAKMTEAEILKRLLAEKKRTVSEMEMCIFKAEKELAMNEKEIEGLRNTIRAFESAEKPSRNREAINKSIKKLEIINEEAIGNRARLSNELKNMREIYEKGVCKVCGQAVSDYSVFSSKVNSLENAAREMENMHKEADSAIADERRQMEYLVRYTSMVDLASAKRKNIDMLEGRNAKLAEEVSMKGALDTLQKEIESISSSIKNLGESERMYSEALKSYDALSTKALEYEKQRSRCIQRIEDLSAETKSIEKEVARKEEARKKAENILLFHDWLDIFFSGLMETVEKHVMTAVQLEFDSIFREWFSMIMSDESMSVRIDDTFSPVIDQNGFETTYENLSGGEKTSVALAYRLALNRVINMMIDSIKTSDILILDEPTDGFSTDQMDRIRDVLSQLPLRQVIIVSHEQKIDTFVDNVIRIYKQNHVSRVN